MRPILPITRSALRADVLRAKVYPDLEQELYWNDSWDPDLYVELARAGFISIAIEHPEMGPLLIPEIQKRYAVLDWPDLHCSRKLRRLLRSPQLVDHAVELRVADSVERVLERLAAYHGDGCWIVERYRDLIRELHDGGDPRLAMHGIELWSAARDEPVAGELGYGIGRTYTSLSGFCARDDPAYRHFGTLQMLWLAALLRDGGYAFWNMGHPDQAYKRALGARILPRQRFLTRWIGARDAAPRAALRPGHHRKPLECIRGPGT